MEPISDLLGLVDRELNVKHEIPALKEMIRLLKNEVSVRSYLKEKKLLEKSEIENRTKNKSKNRSRTRKAIKKG